jgi:hypothetical protein
LVDREELWRETVAAVLPMVTAAPTPAGGGAGLETKKGN